MHDFSRASSAAASIAAIYRRWSTATRSSVLQRWTSLTLARDCQEPWRLEDEFGLYRRQCGESLSVIFYITSAFGYAFDLMCTTSL
jgi:hypothetical protein